jgi:hypothetical protein
VIRLGLDFDNTLISYDRLFLKVALEKGLVPNDTPPRKNAVRDYLRKQDREDEWTTLQGEVYGGRILEAEPYPGMQSALGTLTMRSVPMWIVSHKTKTPYRGEPVDLHAAARGWLAQLEWPQEQAYFELTKEAKVARIVALGCTHYVDDLPEILAMLPDGIEKILFSPNENEAHRAEPSWKRMSSWEQLPTLLGLP